MTGGEAPVVPEPRNEYILPLRWADDLALDSLVDYLRQLCCWIPVTVVDGSQEELYSHHRDRFPSSVKHLRPAAGGEGNGKVRSVLTGVRGSRADKLVIADDDVRYTRDSLTAVLAGLDNADLVRPQNYFNALPWHACWDTSRTLINRAFGGDFPGTLAVRRAALEATGGYAPVLFENLELIRTVTAAGGLEHRAPELFIARVPPTARHFLRQRVRQSYDDFAQPARLVAELALLPMLAGMLSLPARRRTGSLLCVAAVAVVLAEAGRRRDGGRKVFPFHAALFAPLWLLERAVCVWAAAALRVAGGLPYAGSRLKTAAHSPTVLRRRHADKIRPAPAARDEWKTP